jgi:UDP-N-acetylglucosamine 1-carboxyvinyltransferase
MDRIRIVGGKTLNGIIPISGAKNAALPLMIASLLTDRTVTLENLPRLADVSLLVRILSNHGVDYSIDGRRQGEDPDSGQTVHMTAREIVDTTAPYELVSRMRASFWVVAWRAAERRAFRCPAAARSAPARSICCSWRWSASAPRSRSTPAMSSPRRPRACAAARSSSPK